MFVRGLVVNQDPGGASGSSEGSGELSLEQQLEALKPTGHEGDPPPAADGSTLKDGEQPPADTSQPGDQNDPLKALDEIKDEETPADKKAELSPDQTKILETVKTPEEAQQLVSVATGYTNFSNAFQSGNFEQVEKMFESWNPHAFEGFLDYIYDKKVASGEWVDRWIGDKEGNPAVNKGVQNLQREVANLKKQLTDRETREQTNTSQQQQDRVTKQYVDHLDGLFNQIKFAEGDREYVLSMIHNRVASDGDVRKAILSGNTAAVNKIFKDEVRKYIQRDQASAQKRGDTLKAQEQKKAPVQAGGGQQETSVPDDIKQVKKGDEDKWLDVQLGKLASKAGLKKK